MSYGTLGVEEVINLTDITEMWCYGTSGQAFCLEHRDGEEFLKNLGEPPSGTFYVAEGKVKAILIVDQRFRDLTLEATEYGKDRDGHQLYRLRNLNGVDVVPMTDRVLAENVAYRRDSKII